MSKRLPEFSDIKGLERFTGGDYLEARNLVCWASGKTGISLKNLTDGSVKKITVTGKGEGNPKFSPSGEKLLFLSAGKDGRQLYSYNLDTEEVVQLSHFRGPIMEPMWSPDGKKILFASSVSNASGIEPERREDEAVIIESRGYKFDGLGFIRPDGHQHLFVLNTETGEVKKATSVQSADYLHAAWAPDSRSFVCASDCGRSKDDMLGYDLYLISAEEETFGETRQISKDVYIVSYPNPMRPVFTPDGEKVIMGIMKPGSDVTLGYPEIFLYAFPTDGSCKEECLFESDEDCFQCVQFPYNAYCGWGLDKLQISDDGETLYFNAGWMGQGVLYSLALHGDKHAKKLLSGKCIYHGASRVQRGKMMVTRSTCETPEEYLILDTKTGTLTQAVQSAEAYLDNIEIQPTDDFTFETKDGWRIHGYAVAPFHAEHGKKYPTFLYVHGGPTPFYTYGFTVEMQAFAAAGFGVIFCNPRGSTGYGLEHMRQKPAMDGTAMHDVLEFVDAACTRYDWIDPDRMGVTGGSYGGYMTNELAIHTDRFRAYISQRSLPGNLINYASTDLTSPESRGYDSFETFMMDKLKGSQTSYAEKICRPFLILHGEDDYRCPVEGVHQLFTALKDIKPDLPVRMVIFPHTPHDHPSEPRLALRYYNEMVTWFRKYL